MIPEKDMVPEEDLKPIEAKHFVYTIRDWKEYAGESLLIVFSVILALFLTEYFNHLHDKEDTRTALQSIASELKHNKKGIEEMQQYNLQVLAKIDSVLGDKKLQNDLVSNDEFHLKVIAPEGVLYRYLDNQAWEIARSKNIISKVDIETAGLLNRVYEDRDRMVKVESEVAKVIFDRASRDPKQVHTTLVLIRDIYHGWAVDRAEGLVKLMEDAIKKVEPIE